MSAGTGTLVLWFTASILTVIGLILTMIGVRAYRAPDAWETNGDCTCAHPAAQHRHYRAGEECVRCTCPRYRHRKGHGA
jgi:hypothetical protein